MRPAVGGSTIQRLAIRIQGKDQHVYQDELVGGSGVPVDPGRVTALFSRLGLTLPASLASSTFLTETQKQLNKLSLAIDIESPNRDTVLEVLSDLFDGKAPNWTKWNQNQAAERKTALFETEGRLELLDNLRATLFPATPERRLLYLGAGADVGNPLQSTGATSLTLVDSEPFNVELLKNRLRIYHGRNVLIEEVLQATKVVGLIVRDPVSHATLQTVDLRHTGYAPYFKSEHKTFDVIFDKDSWLSDSENHVVHNFVDRLNEGGYWISNHGMAEGFMEDVFRLTGLRSRTETLDDVYRHVSFGYDTVKVYEKTSAYNRLKFQLVYDFTRSIKGVYDTVVKNKPVAAEIVESSKATVNKALSTALMSAASLLDAGPLADRLRGKADNLKNELDRLKYIESDDDDDEPAPKPILVLNGMHLANQFDNFKAGVDPNITSDPHVLYTHKYFKRPYYLEKVDTKPNWILREYTFILKP
jgi:hypothetical protein